MRFDAQAALMHEFELCGTIDGFLPQVLHLAGKAQVWAATWTPRNPDGFPVRLVQAGGRLSGDFGGLITDFETLDAALFWARRAGSAGWRLRIDLVDGRARCWRLERRDIDGRTHVGLASGHLRLLDRFRTVSTRYHSNGPALSVEVKRRASTESVAYMGHVSRRRVRSSPVGHFLGLGSGRESWPSL